MCSVVTNKWDLLNEEGGPSMIYDHQVCFARYAEKWLTILCRCVMIVAQNCYMYWVGGWLLLIYAVGCMLFTL